MMALLGVECSCGVGFAGSVLYFCSHLFLGPGFLKGQLFWRLVKKHFVEVSVVFLSASLFLLVESS